ncbi:JmjC domain-containing protein [Duganella sp. S19_KUP01_CR8]|uniref:JmjC domain-containing protein n=1 Tax=Duganella sp. S19_KUP01_CR8 TaxID=3025502 RepID=UPI002FCD9606
MFDRLDLGGRKAPAFDQVDIPSALNLENLLATIPLAHAKGQVRLIDEHSPTEGYGLGWLAQVLGRSVDALSPSVVDDILAGRLCSLAVQSMDQFDPHIAQIAEELRGRTNRRVGVTAFFSPPRSQGTAVHYDRSDVLVLQVQGSKRWSVHEPVDIEPNFRTPYCLPQRAIEQLKPFGDWDLRRGDVLFLPSGWVHEVKNHADQVCVHLSFVVFSDSVLSVFGNAMTEAYAKLMGQPRWRTRVTSRSLTENGVVQQFEEMLAEFSRVFRDTLGEQPQRLCDHVLNGSAEAAQRSLARATVAALDGGHDDLVLSWVGGHHRAVRYGSKLEVTTEGSARHGVDPELYARCRTCGTVRLSELGGAGLWSDDEVVEFVATMVQDLGLLALKHVPRDAAPPAPTQLHTTEYTL